MTKQKKPDFDTTRILRLRFGHRLSSIFWPLDVHAINQILGKLGYKDFQPDPNGSIQATKTNADFYLDRIKMVFGFYAGTIDSLITAQKEFFASAQKDYRTSLHSYIRFYEIEAILAYYLKESENNKVENIFSDSSDLKEFTNIIGEKVSLSKLELSKSDTAPQDDNWFDIEISPKIESATNAYHCRLIKRSKNNDEITKTLRKSTELLEQVAAYVERKNS